jgi:hypothetical protein
VIESPRRHAPQVPRREVSSLARGEAPVSAFGGAEGGGRLS